MDKDIVIPFKNKQVLLCIDNQIPKLSKSLIKEFEYVKNNFCGLVITNSDTIINDDVIIYMLGDIELNIQNYVNKKIYVIKEFSINYHHDSDKYVQRVLIELFTFFIY